MFPRPLSAIELLLENCFRKRLKRNCTRCQITELTTHVCFLEILYERGDISSFFFQNTFVAVSIFKFLYEKVPGKIYKMPRKIFLLIF